MQRASQPDIDALAEMFPDHVDSDVLEAELEVFSNILAGNQAANPNKLDNGDKVIKFVYNYRTTLLLTWKSYKPLLTAPVLVAKDERTFSHLKFVKGVYRSTMADKRLDNLMILNCEKDLPDALDMKKVLKIWASKPRR